MFTLSLTFSLPLICLLQVKGAAVTAGVAVAGVIGFVALGATLLSLLKDDDKKKHRK